MDYEDWNLVGDTYFSKRILYTLEWARSTRGAPGINLEYMKTSCCPFGGPIAMWHDESKIVLHLGAFSRPDIQLFNAAGRSIGRILWQGGRIISAGWTTDEHFIVVDDRGNVYRYTAIGRTIESGGFFFSLGSACENEGLTDVEIFPDGIVARTAVGTIYYVQDFSEPRVRSLTPAPPPPQSSFLSSASQSASSALHTAKNNMFIGSAVHCFVAVPPSLTFSGSMQLIMSIDNTMYLIDERESIPTHTREGSIVKISLSPDGRYAAGYAVDAVDDGIVIWEYNKIENELVQVATIFLSDTQETFAEFRDSNLSENEVPLDSLENNNNNNNNNSQGIIVSSGYHHHHHQLPSGLPDIFQFCGTDAVIAIWFDIGTLLVAIPPRSQQQPSITPPQHAWWDIGGPGPIIAATELDGIRLVSSDHHMFIRRVPQSIVAVLEIGSTSPGALLYDARRLYEERDARAAAGLLDILKEGRLREAVDACLDAAAKEMDPQKQEGLMHAGCYGRAFLALGTSSDAMSSNTKIANAANTNATTTTIAATARKLRILNALREDTSIAMPLTMDQLDAGLDELSDMHRRLLRRLTTRHHYLLALRICHALGLPSEDVLLQWACDKISASASSMSDQDLLDALCAKLQGQTSSLSPVYVKWARISAHAQSQGRRRLAAALAERETCAADQIPLLVSLGEEEKALERAILSDDPDLIFYVVYTMWRRLNVSPSTGGGASGSSPASTQHFWACISKFPAARALFTAYLVSGNTKNDGIRDIESSLIVPKSIGNYEQIAAAHIDRIVSLSASVTGRQGLGSGDDAMLSVKNEWIKAKEAFQQAEKQREDKFESAAASAALRLHEVQAELEQSTKRDGFVGLSVVDTVKLCLRLGLRDQAQKVAKEFKVPEKQQMLLAINASASSQDWNALQQMAGRLDRRAPVTMEHFVAASRNAHAPVAVIKWFVDRITGDHALSKRAQLYAELGLMHEAAMLAEQAELAGGSGGVLGSLREAVGGMSFIGGGPGGNA